MSKHTPGPWKWFGNAGSEHLYLATTHSGRRYVMDFVRWGMRSAQPRFQPGQPRSGMIPAKDLLKFEVGDRSITGIDAAKMDGSVYRYDVIGIDCEDARLIAKAWMIPEKIVPLLQKIVDRYDSELGLIADLDQIATEAYALLRELDGEAS
ncbi:hypothetical protein JL101_035705 (plasmid) [Skermanella rosea]|uniref:hypothetical protein n=1 Tax=Skermanella rosea TaxID=1817965 RepID=UPI001933BBC8|nr:hypothetical protein [Skermanella rosea]UEM07998.1 hypothetical protein JL101_035705 [Skermanella rosea]